MKHLITFVSTLLVCTLIAGPAQQMLIAVIGANGGGVSFTDDFNRANESPIAGNWETNIGSFNGASLISNRIIGTGGNWLARVATSAATFPADQSASTVLLAGNEGFVGAVVRIQSDGSCYAASYLGGGSARIYKFVGTSATTPFSDYTATFSSGDVLKISATGSGSVTLTLYQNGSSLGTRTDSSSPYNSGQPGIWGGDSISTDDFVGIGL